MSCHSNNHHRRTLLVFVVFAFSLLPRQLVHNFVTNHHHIRLAGYVGEHLWSPETINCSGDNIFLNQAFTTVHAYSFQEPLEWKVCPDSRLPLHVATGDAAVASTRGPPSSEL